MKFAYYCIAAILAALVIGGPAGAKTDPHAAAVNACMSADGLQPAAFVIAVDDGRGGSLVWLTDADANLWLCNANEEGKVFAFTQMTGDLLKGAGAYLDNEGKVIGSGSDGLTGDWIPGFYVFVETENGLFLCDATGDAQVWAFAEIGDPIGILNRVG
jgi:hypothetical protein